MIGSPGASVGRARNAGELIVLPGSGQGLDLGLARAINQDTPEIPGEAESRDHFGSVLAAGDVNADGWPDFIVGAPKDHCNGRDTGCARVYSGFDGSILYSFHGLVRNNTGERRGFSVGCVGDANNDGHDDVIVGSPEAFFSSVNQPVLLGYSFLVLALTALWIRLVAGRRGGYQPAINNV